MYASQFDLDVRAAICENENVHKKIDLEIFRLQGTKSTFLQPYIAPSIYIDSAKLSSIKMEKSFLCKVLFPG